MRCWPRRGSRARRATTAGSPRRSRASLPAPRAALTLPSGEASTSDEEARLLAHLLVARTLVAAGLALDERVVRAMSAAYALSWTTEGGAPYHTTPLVLAVSLWLVALDPAVERRPPAADRLVRGLLRTGLVGP